MVTALVKAVEAQKPATGGGAKTWWRWPLLFGLVLLGVLIAAWALGRDRRELAKLRHARNKETIEAANAVMAAKVAESEQVAEEAMARVVRSRRVVLELDKQIAQGEKSYAERLLEIEKITWDDLPRGDSGE